MSNDAESAGTDTGRRIAEQRARAGLTVAEAAERAGMAPEYLAYLESSMAPNPSQAALIRLAAALGTTPSCEESFVSVICTSTLKLEFRSVEIASARLAASGSGDLAHARTLLGDDAWELLRSDRPAPEDRSAPGLPLRRIASLLDAVEGL